MLGSMMQSGHLRKMSVELAETVRYQLPLDDHRVELNALVGQQLRLEYGGEIHCHHCGRKTKKVLVRVTVTRVSADWRNATVAS